MMMRMNDPQTGLKIKPAKQNAHAGHARELRHRHQRHAHIEHPVSRLMLERVAGFVRGHADRGHRPAVKIFRRKKQRAFGGS